MKGVEEKDLRFGEHKHLKGFHPVTTAAADEIQRLGAPKHHSGRGGVGEIPDDAQVVACGAGTVCTSGPWAVSSPGSLEQYNFIIDFFRSEF